MSEASAGRVGGGSSFYLAKLAPTRLAPLATLPALRGERKEDIKKALCLRCGTRPHLV